jgi:hypothetical protein
VAVGAVRANQSVDWSIPVPWEILWEFPSRYRPEKCTDSKNVRLVSGLDDLSAPLAWEFLWSPMGIQSNAMGLLATATRNDHADIQFDQKRIQASFNFEPISFGGTF